MGLYKRKRSPFWWLQYYAHGERIQESSGTTSRAEALQLLQRRKQELKDGTWRHPRNRGMKFSKLVEEYFDSIAFASLADKTRAFYEQRIEKLLEHFGPIEVFSMSRKDVERYIKKRTEAKQSQTTIAHEITTLVTILKWGARESVISHVPFSTERLKPARDEFRSRVLSPDEEKAILKAAQPYQQAQIIAALDAGMHKKEIFGQKWIDIDFDRNLILMTTSKKGRVSRIVPLTIRFRQVLESLKRESEYVFTFRGERILTDTKKGWYRILSDAEVAPIRFHDLRATYGTRLEEIGVPPAVCMSLMGHKRKAVHDRYIRPQLPVLRDAIARLDRWLIEQGLVKEDREGKVVSINFAR